MDATSLDLTKMALLMLLVAGVAALLTWRVWVSALGTTPGQIRSTLNQFVSTPLSIDEFTIEQTATMHQKLQFSLKRLNQLDVYKLEAERNLTRVRGLYETLRRCNHAIIESRDTAWLLNRMCEILVDCGPMAMAWVGDLDEANETIRPISSYGVGQDYLQTLHISTNPTDVTAYGPTATAFRTGEPVWIHDFQTDTTTLPWRAKAEKYGWVACAALPIRLPNKEVNVLTIYSRSNGAFSLDLQILLKGVVQDIEFALEAVVRRANHEDVQKKIYYLGRFDSLTGLPNRAHFQHRTEEIITYCTDRNVEFALMFLDIDHFKDVNDSLGHPVGDQLLMEISKRLKASLRQDDIVARFGGDEFVLVLQDVGIETAQSLAHKVLESIAQPLQLQHFEIHPTTSIGIAMFPKNGRDLETLSKNADLAMYAAKVSGRNKYCLFTEEMQVQSARHLTLLTELRHALARDQFSVCYQAQVSVVEGRIVGAEALLRWQHPDLGPISPTEFIPICEESGLIIEIGEWVIRQAVRHANIWIAKGNDPIVVSVNLSPAQFRQQNLPDVVTSILKEEGLSPDYLEFELTETLVMHDAQKAIEKIETFATRGLRFSIDDFGTGYSCLSYLKKFRVSKLKIDQSFVRDIEGKEEDRALVKAIIQIAHSLGMATIAEGVETQEQLSFLSLQGCVEFQGYLINKPMGCRDFECLLEKSKERWLSHPKVLPHKFELIDT